MKLLSIGNSFSQDAQEWLHQIAVANGVELETTNLMIGGCSLETHYNHITDGESAYYLEQNGQNCNRTVTLPEGLALDEWDVVTVQQVSHHSGQPQTYIPYLTELVAFVKEKCPKVKIYFHQTWAYEIDSTHPEFVRYDHDQKKMYDALTDAYARAAAAIDAKLIPCGEVIQTLRRLSPFDYAHGGRSLCRDGFHMDLTYGRYALAAAWYECLTGRDVRENHYVPCDEAQEDVLALVKETVHRVCSC